jgi:hypothetical protein
VEVWAVKAIIVIRQFKLQADPQCTSSSLSSSNDLRFTHAEWL